MDGLSLFICRAIAEQHGGEISVTSRPDEGDAFVVVLPLMQEEIEYVDTKADDPGR